LTINVHAKNPSGGEGPAVHAEAKQTVSFQKRRRRIDCRVKPGNDDTKERSRGAFFASEVCLMPDL